jgi:hypothetical protein
MKTLFFGSIALLGAWLLGPQLQVEHDPVLVPTTTATTAAADANAGQPAQKPTTKKGGTTMR